MVHVTYLTLSIFIGIFLAIGYASAKPNLKVPAFQDLTNSAEDKTLMLIVAVQKNSKDTKSELDDEVTVNNNQRSAAKLLQLLLKQSILARQLLSVELSDVNQELHPSLRYGCQQALRCQQQCKQDDPCKDMCKVVYDSRDQCKTTTTRDPCAKTGRTMPPKWRLLLRALQQQKK